MSIVAAIESRLGTGEPVTVASLGGAAAIAAEAGAIVRAPFLDVLVSLASTATAEDEVVLDDLVLRGFAEATQPVPFRDAVNAVMGSVSLRVRIEQRLQKILEQRVENRRLDSTGLVAAYALEALFRLALAGATNKHRPLGIMVEIGPEESGLFAEHAAKLMGAAFHVWGDEDLLRTLDHLRANTDAEGEAAFELGLARLAQALAADSLPDILQRLETARILFMQARYVDEDRADAVAYCAIIDVIRGFSSGVPRESLQAPLNDLMTAVADRTRLLHRGTLPEWLRPRVDRDAQWVRLLRTVEGLAADLERPSWLNAWTAMEQLLAVYDADRTVSVGVGLEALLRPTIEAKLISERGLLAHLDDLLQDERWLREHGETALALRARIDELARDPTSLGKALEGAPYPRLRSALRNDQQALTLPSDMAERLEVALGERVRQDGIITHPIVQRILADMRDAFSSCSDYQGTIRDDFDELVIQLIMFCKDRQDAGRAELGARGAYLHDPNATEFDLQADLREWLSGNLRRGDSRTEVPGVAAGRADIYVTFGAHRFIVELKRHHGVVDRDNARRYLGQAGSYQGTNVKLGMVGILELIDRTGPPASLEECIWYDAIVPEGAQVARHHLVFRVPGSLIAPSLLSRSVPSRKVAKG